MTLTVVLAILAVTAGAASAVATTAPQNTAPPKINGLAQVGQTLTTDNGTWSSAPNSFSYSWQRCDAAGANCVGEPNGTTKTYTLVGIDRGHTIRVNVTATNADGGTPAQSAQTAVVTATRRPLRTLLRRRSRASRKQASS